MSTAEQIQADAASLVTMSVADLVAHLETVDLETLKAALEAEQAKGDGARKGAVAALESAIAGHPEQAAEAAAAAEGEQGGQDQGSEQPPADEQADPARQEQEGDEQAKGDGDETPPAPVEQPEPTEQLSDKPTDPDAVSAAPARPHEGLVNQLQMRWDELKYFVSQLEGDVEDELGEVLAFVRSKL